MYQILNSVCHDLGGGFPKSSTSNDGARPPAWPRGGAEPHPGNGRARRSETRWFRAVSLVPAVWGGARATWGGSR